jgi:uncharacterized protein YgiB involved in biofilm formation
MATPSLPEVENRASDTGLYNSANECLAIKPEACAVSLQDALAERLEQAKQFLAELNRKDTHSPRETGTDEALEDIRAERAHKGGVA